jgi:hypothetical protein
LENDRRIATLLDMIFARYEDMDFEYILTTIWSLGILVSGYQ